MRYYFGFLVLLLWSCSSLKKTAVPPQPAPKQEIVQKPYQPSAEKKWELIKTNIDISFDFQKRTANATTQISLHPYFYPTDAVVLDAKGMKIIEVMDQQNHPLEFSYDTLRLSIKLPEVYTKSDTLSLKIKYVAMPYGFETHTGSAITEDRGLYFVNAHQEEPYQPMQIWTQGETEANSHWFPTFDKTNFRSSFEITMHVPDSFSTLSNGILTKSVPEANGQKAETWFQETPIPPYLVMMAASDFHIEKDIWNGKEVNYYVPQRYAPFAKCIFRHTPEMIAYFSKMLKLDFPWDKYSQVVVYDYVSGAMENVSASLFGAFILKDQRQIQDDNNDYIVAHELFHQWFGDYVTAESWSHITLNESFADYSEKLWAEYKYGASAAEKGRIESYQKYITQAQSNDPSLVRYYYDQADEVFDRVSYSKGGLILHYLRKIVGDEAFFESLHLYLAQNALQSAEADQLRLCFEKITGKDLKWFFDQWYFRGGHPVLSVSYTYDDSKKEVSAIVTQVQDGPLYRLPFKAQIIRNGKSETVDWDLKEKRQVFIYPYKDDSYQDDPYPVIIPDAEFWIPGQIHDKKNMAQLLVQMKYASGLMAKERVLWMLDSKKMNADSIKLILELALKDKDAFVRTTALQYFMQKESGTLGKWFSKTIGNLAATDPDNDVKMNALYVLGNLKDGNYSSTYEIAISDSSYKVASAGLYAMEQINHNKAVELARAMLEKNGNSALFLTMAGRITATDGSAVDYSFYERSLLRFFERDRASMLLAFYEYLSSVKDTVTFEKGIKLWQGLIARDATSLKNYTSPQYLYSLYFVADRKMKAASNAGDITLLKAKKTIALDAWTKLKTSTKDEALLKELVEFEGKE